VVRYATPLAARPAILRQGRRQVLLERLEAASLFIVPLDDTRTWYRYHHLFADFLRERLRRDDSRSFPRTAPAGMPLV